VVEVALTLIYLVAFFTERDPCLVVEAFTSQRDVARSTLEAAFMVSPV